MSAQDGVSTLPPWPGAGTVYRRAYRTLAIMGAAGHATAPKKDKRGKIIEQGTVSEEMRALVDALNRGDEEVIKGLLLQTHVYPWGGSGPTA